MTTDADRQVPERDISDRLLTSPFLSPCGSGRGLGGEGEGAPAVFNLLSLADAGDVLPFPCG